jgi:GGDEF domain-containing protein
MYNLVLEEKATGERFFILANTKKGFKEKMLAERILNTFNKGLMKSYDSVESVGITIKKINSDIHSNLIKTKTPKDIINDIKDTIDLN